MWTTLLVLAIALNFEPTRLGVIGLITIRPHPIPQLLAFLSGSFLTSAGAGLLVLHVLHDVVSINSRFNGAKVQIAVGVLALIVAAVLASNITASRSGANDSSDSTVQTAQTAAAPGQPRVVEWLSERLGGLIHGSSPWFAGAMGVGLAIPSVDYIALLLVIATSGVPLPAQAGALLAFLTIANIVLLAPIAAYLIAPEPTKAAIAHFRNWVLARRRRDYAILLAIAGGLLAAVGIRGLGP